MTNACVVFLGLDLNSILDTELTYVQELLNSKALEQHQKHEADKFKALLKTIANS